MKLFNIRLRNVEPKEVRPISHVLFCELESSEISSAPMAKIIQVFDNYTRIAILQWWFFVWCKTRIV
jgi:hypothetical protein